jgi:hypothetical protein
MEEDKKICEGLNCGNTATEQIRLNIEDYGTLDVFVCKKCLPIFIGDEN